MSGYFVFAKCGECGKEFSLDLESEIDDICDTCKQEREFTQWCSRCKKQIPATRKYWSWNKKYNCPSNNICKRCAHEMYIENPDRAKAACSKRRNIVQSAKGNHTAADIRLQLKTQKGLCWWCGEPMNEDQSVDHRVPLSKGGSNAPENIVITHLSCNLSKGAKMPWEFNGRLL